MKKLCHHLFGKVWFRTGGGVRPRWNQLAEVIVEMVNVVDEAGVRDVKVKTAEYLPCVWSVVRWSALRGHCVEMVNMVVEAGVGDVKVKTAEYLPCVWSVVRWSALRATAVRRRSMV